MPTSEVDVLVVGAGPVGLTMAAELWRHGVPCRLVDRKAAPARHSKAAGIQARTLEVFADMGTLDAILARGRRMTGGRMYAGTRPIAGFDIRVEGSRHDYILGLSQRETELILAEHLARLGGAVEWRVACEGFEADADGITATLCHRAGDSDDDSADDCADDSDGTRETVRARWLVGCDGAHSTIRRRLGLPFEGSTFERTLVQADIGCRFPFAVDPHHAVMFTSPEGVMGALPLLGEGRYRVIALDPPAPLAEPSLENLRALAALRAPPGLELADPAWIVDFRFHGRLASRYRVGRVFLAGDAAHIHSPIGAQGMNLGIQDAYGLAWKLALVARGRGRPALLDTYEPERRPVGEAVVRETDAATTRALRVLGLRSRGAQALRNAIVPLILNRRAVQRRLTAVLGGVRVHYRGGPMATERRVSPWRALLGGGVGFGDARRFAAGPRAGDRVPELEGAGLHDRLRGTAHVALAFTGRRAPPDFGPARAVAARFGDAVRLLRVVWGTGGGPDALDDPDGAVHRHFGATAPALVVVRPDGHVGWRSQPPDAAALGEWLDRWLVSAAPPE